MRASYALVGLGFIILIVGAYVLSHQREMRTNQISSMLSLSSLSFQKNGIIPAKFTCDGANVNPALLISGVPPETKSLALIMDDPDIPQAVKDAMHLTEFDHWVVFNMPPETKEIPEHAAPPGVEGSNTAGKSGYTGPCPPDKEHRYFFRLYALDTVLPLRESASRLQVEKAMEGHVIESAELMARYNRPQNSAR